MWDYIREWFMSFIAFIMELLGQNTDKIEPISEAKSEFKSEFKSESTLDQSPP